MTYKNTVEWMYGQLPMYQRKGAVAYKKDLSNTIALSKALGQPQEHFKSIHVAGTNGKGSTCHILSAIYQTAGYKVGLYTSPHLKDFRERIKIDGIPCSADFVVDFIHTQKDFLLKQQCSFFEMTVGMAFAYFAQQEVDIAIIETGLGGRLDSTNIIQPELSVITAIDRDHTAILGNTLTKIATEKAGIIKKDTPVVVAEQRTHLRSLFRRKAKENNSAITFVDHRKTTPPSDLRAYYQRYNIRTALTAVDVMQEKYPVSERQVVEALGNVGEKSQFYGRYTVVQKSPLIIADTAHNPAGLKALMKQIKTEKHDQLEVIIGMVNDKEIGKALAQLPKEAQYTLVEANIPRAMPVDELYKVMKKEGFSHLTKKKDVLTTFVEKKKSIKTTDLLLITGSTFVVAEIF